MKKEIIIENNKEYLVYTHADGYRVWYWNGVCHREAGPAIIDPSGDQEWCYEGEYLNSITSQEEFIKWLKLRIFK